MTVRPYREAIAGVETQFALLRFGLKTLSPNKIRTFFKDRKLVEQRSVIESLELLKKNAAKHGCEFREIEPNLIKEVTRGKYPKGKDPLYREVSEDRLNQSELLLLVAHFESSMRRVHQRFLEADPSMVFSKDNYKARKVPMTEVFAGNFPDKFLKEQIIKEVKKLDSDNIGNRAKYFDENFGASFGTPEEIRELAEIMRSRNMISHEIYTPPPKSLDEMDEQPLVSDGMLSRARILFLRIPNHCIQIGARKYQSFFKDW